jgi:rubredoxin
MRNNDERTGAVQQSDSPAPSQPQTGQTGLNFVAPTEFVQIPSKGKFYPQGHPLCGVDSVEIRQMTAKEEDILSSKTLLKQGVAIDRFLQSVIVDKGLNSDSMLIGDKNALIVAARCTGYGHEYGTTITCPSCTTNTKLDIDLEDAKSLYGGYGSDEESESLDGVEGPDTLGNYHITLPVSKARFEVKLMTGREEKAFAKRLETRRKKRQAEAMMTDQFKTFTLSINGVGDLRQMYKFIDNLPVRDSRFLRNQYAKLSPALNLKHDFECRECGYEQEVEVPITAQFFWPDA